MTSSTVSTTSSSPISRLTDDILWFIFMLNTHIPLPDNQVHTERSLQEPYALDTARKSSQVCRGWRRILLSTSSIWGRLMDWRSLNQETDHWRNEVLRRSGTSNLWIEGYLGVNLDDYMRFIKAPVVKDSTFDFFSQLLDRHWGRVQRLSMSMTDVKHIDPNARGVNNPPVSRPAPNLETFILSRSSFMFRFGGQMFSGHAPRLRTFDAGSMYCSLEASWMSNIRSLTLGSAFNNKEVCEILPHIPRLEVLDLQYHTAVDGYHAPLIRPPHLHTLRISGSLFYLHAIEPAPGAKLCLDMGRGNIPNRDFLRPYASHIAKILGSYASHHSTTDVILRCRTEFSFFDSKLKQSTTRGTPQFIINLLPRPEIFDDVMEFAFDMLPVSFLSTVTHLILDCTAGLQPRFCQTLMRFLMKFQALENLGVWDETILGLLELHFAAYTSGRLLLFPKLTTLTLLDLGDEEGPANIPDWRKRLYSFLSLRNISLRLPITTLNLTPIAPDRLQRDLDFIDVFAGVKVKWKQGGEVIEYICGSGHSRMLRFQSNPS